MRSLSVSIVLLVALSVTGCGPASIETLCGSVAEEQCNLCYDCADGVDASGARLCQLDDPTLDRASCTDTLQARCEDQSATLEKPKREIGDCQDSLAGDRACREVYDSFAQDHSPTTPECTYFL